MNEQEKSTQLQGLEIQLKEATDQIIELLNLNPSFENKASTYRYKK